MKIVVFAPHPDDELIGCGGSILKWLNEGHDVHLVFVTDNRALFAQGHVNEQLIDEYADKFRHLTEDEIAVVALNEAEEVSKSYGIKKENVHYFKFHDLDAKNNIKLGVNLTKKIIKDANRIVIPSNNNPHEDHQATHLIVKKAVKELDLNEVEFYVYALYLGIKAPRDKVERIKITEYNDKIYEITKIYKTQQCFIDTRAVFEHLKNKKSEKFGIFQYEDAGKFYNF
jgi:LmbE family N-acetylglucosaminyl deacetylase